MSSSEKWKRAEHMAHPSSLIWFRYGAQDLHPREWLSLHLHTLRCPTCRARLAQVKRDLASAPEPPPLPGRSESRPPRRWFAPVVGLAVAAASALLVVQLPEEELRAKGGSRFDLYSQEPFALLGRECRPGQTVQGVIETERAYALILNIDPAGHAAVVFPGGAERSGPSPEGSLRLPESWTFDAVEGRERFIALFSDQPLSAAAAFDLALAPSPPEGVERIERACEKSTLPEELP